MKIDLLQHWLPKPCLLKRQVAVAALAAALLMATPAAAQDPATRPQSPTPTPTPTTTDVITTPQQPLAVQPVVRAHCRAHAGARSGQSRALDVARCNSGRARQETWDIELERENVRLQQYDLIAAQGFYDPAHCRHDDL